MLKMCFINTGYVPVYAYSVYVLNVLYKHWIYDLLNDSLAKPDNCSERHMD